MPPSAPSALGVVAALASAAAVAAQSGDADLITNLPGWTGAQNMYSGYVTVNASHNRNLFYWLVESAGDPSNDPLVLWTNGGPGCSSLSGGLFSEFGPFRPNADGSLTLTPNPWTWTQHANIIFLEQPAGVGFSWSADTSDYTTGDAQSAHDAYEFLLGFTARFPRYAGREIYISGESYGGEETAVRRRAASGAQRAASGGAVRFTFLHAGACLTAAFLPPRHIPLPPQVTTCRALPRRSLTATRPAATRS